MKKLAILPVLLWLLVSSCTPTPKPIEYGSDSCDFCKMTIVDSQHAAEAVTSKGKVFKFDAIECMINFVKKYERDQFALQLVSDYSTPGSLTDAGNCYFLISPNLPSPMGANLTAFKERPAALEMQKEKGGEIYDWKALYQKMDNTGAVNYSEK